MSINNTSNLLHKNIHNDMCYYSFINNNNYIIHILITIIILFTPFTVIAQNNDVDNSIYDNTNRTNYLSLKKIPGVYQANSNVENDEKSESVDNIVEPVSSGLNKHTPLIKTSILTAYEMDLFGDYSIEDALARMAGFQVDNQKNLNFRGAGLNRYHVTLNGYRVASTGFGDRSFDLGSVPADIIDHVQLQRLVTPDMDAGALSGNINIMTMRPVDQGLKISARLGGGAHPRYFSYMGPESRVTADYSQRLTDELSLSVNLAQHHENRGRDILNRDYDAFDFGNGFTDVYERVSASMQTSERNRLGASVQLAFEPADHSQYFLNGFIVNDKLANNQHRNIWDTGRDWVRPDSTGASGRRGHHVYDAMLQDTRIQHHTLQATARRNFNSFNLGYGASWSRSAIDNQNLHFPFLVEDLNYTINLEKQHMPVLEMTNIPFLRDGTVDRRRFLFQPVDRTKNEHVDNTFTGRIDFEIPLSTAFLKIGTSANLVYKEGLYRDSHLNYAGRLNLSHFEVIKRGAFDPFDHYHIPWLLEPETARHFFQSARPGFSKDEDLEREKSDIWNYQTKEQVYAAYGMFSYSTGRLTLLGGARIEFTNNSTDGRETFLDDRGSHEATLISNVSNDYVHVFPNVQLIVAVGEYSNLRLGYSKTNGRPDFNLLSPFQLVDERDSTLFRGNPQLQPVLSDNLDLMFEKTYSTSGLFSVNLFFKKLSGFIIETHQTVNDGEFTGWQERSFKNDTESATVYGFELAVQQDFDFLPGFLGNFSTISNYTFSDSEYEVDFRDNAIPLLAQSPHVVNTALQYTQERFTGRLAYHWSARSLARMEESRRIAPSLDPVNESSLNIYQENWTDLSASIRIQLTERFQFWADAYNILNLERIRYEHSRDIYPLATVYRGGFGFRTGIQFTL